MDQNEGDFQDQVVGCRDCGAEFVFSAGEQAFFAQKGFQAPPKRCKSCREKKKTGAEAGGGGGGGGGGSTRFRSSPPVEVQEKPARTFRPRDGGGGSGPRGAGRDSGGGGDRVQVTCSSCGMSTSVPFEPAPNRPVYCRDCYQKMRR
jgi:CxxC-x17-CxxC domain-containing protein